VLGELESSIQDGRACDYLDTSIHVIEKPKRLYRKAIGSIASYDHALRLSRSSLPVSWTHGTYIGAIDEDPGLRGVAAMYQEWHGKEKKAVVRRCSFLSIFLCLHTESCCRETSTFRLLWWKLLIKSIFQSWWCVACIPKLLRRVLSMEMYKTTSAYRE